MFIYLKIKFFHYFLLADLSELEQPIERWRVSALRIILVSSFLLCLAIAIHSSFSALHLQIYYVLPLTIGFYAVTSIQIWFSKKYYRLSAYSLLISIVASAISINTYISDPALAMLGPIFMYSLPLVAFVLLGPRPGFCCMLLNILPFWVLLDGIHLGRYLDYQIDLEYSDVYIHSLVFLFFNICVPLAVARASVATTRLNAQISAQNTRLRSQNNLYHTLFVDAAIAKLIVTGKDCISEMNQAAESLLECQFSQLPAPVCLSALFCELSTELNEVIVNRTVAGRMKALKITRCMTPDDNYFFVTIQDVTAKALLHKTLTAQTQVMNRHKNYNEATGLPNRLWLENKLAVILGEDQEKVCLIVLKIDNTQFIEHKYGSHCISQIIRKLAALWRAKTPIECLTAAIDPGYLTIVVNGLTVEQIQELISNFVEYVPKVFSIKSQDIPLVVKVGVSFSGATGSMPEKLINNALYAADSSKSFLNFYENASLQRFIEYEEINILLNEAITNNELHIVYQPKVYGDGRLFGLEALLRWDSAVIGAVSPAIFIPIAEKSGLVVQITHWLIEHVCKQIDDWNKAGLDTVPVAINISGADLDQKDFHQHLLNTIIKYKIQPQALELELTESARTMNPKAAVETVQYLANWGFCITLDDFGVGYSGLSKLTTYPVKRVKIDRQFIKDIHKDAKKAKVVEAIIAMCKVFDIDILAEGVEVFEEVDKLLTLGCSTFQGFVFSKPIMPEYIAKLLISKNLLARDVIKEDVQNS